MRNAKRHHGDWQVHSPTPPTLVGGVDVARSGDMRGCFTRTAPADVLPGTRQFYAQAEGVAVAPQPAIAVAPPQQGRPPEWGVYEGHDAFPGESAGTMPAGDVGACRERCVALGCGGFVVWQGTASHGHSSLRPGCVADVKSAISCCWL
eukprot:gene58093-biopygen113069